MEGGHTLGQQRLFCLHGTQNVKACRPTKCSQCAIHRAQLRTVQGHTQTHQAQKQLKVKKSNNSNQDTQSVSHAWQPAHVAHHAPGDWGRHDNRGISVKKEVSRVKWAPVLITVICARCATSCGCLGATTASPQHSSFHKAGSLLQQHVVVTFI